MAAKITIYCLGEVTDYLEFERLCHSLMSIEDYGTIEPLGGFKDKGRDAIHVNTSNETTIFAYSVREDWRAKLAEDAKKIKDHGHTCNSLVFITNAKFTASQRDEAVAFIEKEYNWKLELFGVERLQILLDTKHPQIKKQYPSIFPPEFLTIQEKIKTSSEQEHLFISCVDNDGVFADWLTRKLTAEGYLVWCQRFKLLGGETFPDDVDDAIKNQTFRFLGLYSQAPLNDQEIMRQRSIALDMRNEYTQDFLIPLDVDGVDKNQLDSVTKTLQSISFKDNWADGLKQLLEKLESIDCPRLLPNGKRIVAEAFLGNDVRSDEIEIIFSNCLRIHQIPDVIYRYITPVRIQTERLEKLSFEWSFRNVDSQRFLSFQKPPESIMTEYKLTQKGGSLWADVERIDGISTYNLASELIRKAIIVKCFQKGLKYCPETKQIFFPLDIVEKNRLKFIRPDSGLETYVLTNGKRKHPSGGNFLYSLAPSFYVRHDFFDHFTVLVRIRVRLSDEGGKVFSTKRTIDSRRKYLCKMWWNKQWLNRTIAVSQFLADDDMITIGEHPNEQIIIDKNPLTLDAPIGINEEVFEELSYERSDLLRNNDEFLDEYTIKDEVNSE